MAEDRRALIETRFAITLAGRAALRAAEAATVRGAKGRAEVSLLGCAGRV
jgi:hypothetical protein